ncbi:MAG: FliM/FliN family flagellar motor switch protein [Deltaproteobacteria bacterium]|nr:FliM/FliN family flagellar motor switch protein [Deltaproteobacteria bacterium]MCW5804089.1 FliM/FliN family flagellar motor switch protein [Deltaproteobacteria bacterium]
MSEALLDPQEMEAIQAAIRETAPRRNPAAPSVEPTRLALITDDRIAEAARPVLLALANRVVRIAPRALRPHLPGSWQLDVAGAEIIDGATAKEELRGGWTGGMAVDAEGNGEELVVAVHGAVIDIAAARRCGAAAPTSDASRPPSAVSLRLFQPAGTSLLDSWTAAWREMYPHRLAASGDLGIVARLIESRSVVRVALAFSGGVAGRVQIYARPEVLVPRPAALAAFKANALRIATALSNVPVDVVVELGTLRMPLRALRNLAPGATHTLQGFVDSRVPVYCGGVLKAWGRPVVCRGVLAVQIESVVHGQGSKS